MLTTFAANGATETFVALEAPVGLSFDDSLRELFRAYDSAIGEVGLKRDSAVVWRFHVSDIFTQTQSLRKHLEDHGSAVFTSVVEQPPASSSKLALEAYHIGVPDGRVERELCRGGLLVRHGAYRSLWGKVLPNHKAPSAGQTTDIFDSLAAILREHGGTVRDNVMRTWIYVRDIDNNYQGMVDARREWFADAGMTRDTHYIASTGIEGSAERPSDLVQTDYLAVLGLSPEQVEHMGVLTHMSPTHDYGVTFERATRITYGDRSHYYVSGTASIDRHGKVVYIGDVIRQTEHTMENIRALLDTGGARFDDLKLLVVYLRDCSDYLPVRDYLAAHIPPSVAYVLARGAVCRPTWLVEMDGIAVTAGGDSRFPAFC